ncbi:MAG: amino acid permease [candidate division WOR-3 bacterium]|nr:MAG: amino acid permease [candidate division WOR-3 bacterium]
MALKKELGLFEVFSIAAGAMISSGLFVLPGIAFAKAGPAMILSYVIAGVLVLPALLSKAELVTAMPKAGGDYFYITRSLGIAPGTVAGMASWLSLSLKTAFALMGMGIFAILINPGLSIPEIKAIAVVLCLIFMIINLLGIKEAGITQILLVMVLIAILGLYVIKGFTSVDPSRLDDFMPHGFGRVLSTAGLVFISFGGLTKVASIAEEIRNPKITVPVGMLLAYFVILGLYITVAFVTVGILQPEILSESLTPISTGARTFWGLAGVIVTAIAALLAFISTANAGIMSASRYPLAMSRDQILPGIFSNINRRFKTPHTAIIVTSLFMIVTILFLELEVLVKAASTMLLLLYISANLAVIVMRESHLQNYQPSFRSPLYPYIQIAGILGYSFLIVDMGTFTLATTAVFIIGALLWYFLYVRPKITRESALVYIVERVTDRQIATDTLREELREVVKEREEIIEDEFDHIIKDAMILDIEKRILFEDFIQIASERLSKRLDVPKEEFVRLFIEREKQSCTALRPGLAIPHIIIEGHDRFDVMLVRAKEGIVFPDAPEPVYVVFVLVGTQDRRRSHLRALMAIAQISQHPDFDRNWRKVARTKDLRDMILLGKRKRH